MGRFVIVAYTPKAGKEAALLAAVKKHLEVLGSQQLISDRPGCVMRAGDGSIVEVFEWRSAEAIQQGARQSRRAGAVGRIWRRL